MSIFVLHNTVTEREGIPQSITSSILKRLRLQQLHFAEIIALNKKDGCEIGGEMKKDLCKDWVKKEKDWNYMWDEEKEPNQTTL